MCSAAAGATGGGKGAPAALNAPAGGGGGGGAVAGLKDGGTRPGVFVAVLAVFKGSIGDGLTGVESVREDEGGVCQGGDKLNLPRGIHRLVLASGIRMLGNL